MKSYTDIEQSKKLAEILPLESADMFYDRGSLPFFIDKYVTHESIKNDKYQHLIPCWSLAALLNILTEQDFIIKNIGNEFNIDILIRHCKIWFSSLLDAAFEMIVWLKENGKI